MILFVKKALPALVLLAVAVGLSSCYLPARFDCEIELTREGYYKVFFSGYVVDARMYADLKHGKLTPAQEGKAVQQLQADITRDPSASDFGYIRDGYFRMKWHREGDLLKAKSVTFLRRNETFFTIDYNKDTHVVKIQGRSLSTEQKDRLVKEGLNMNGQFRVITDAKVIYNNADTTKDFPARGPRTKVYIWQIPNIYRATPKMQISLR